jgi:hypothetical protein
MFGWLRREPRHLVDLRHRMSQALADYPVYEPPHRQGPNAPRGSSDEEARAFAARGRENFVYFEERRAARLSALRAFLAKFDVVAGLEEGLAVVSAWLPGNCGALIPAHLSRDETMQLFYRYLAPWEGNLRGLNAIFDLGVFFGECVIARNRNLHWINWPGASDNGVAISSAFNIDGFRSRRDALDPMGRMLRLCEDDAHDIRKKTPGERVSVTRLLGTVRDYSKR